MITKSAKHPILFFVLISLWSAFAPTKVFAFAQKRHWDDATLHQDVVTFAIVPKGVVDPTLMPGQVYADRIGNKSLSEYEVEFKIGLDGSDGPIGRYFKDSNVARVECVTKYETVEFPQSNAHFMFVHEARHCHVSESTETIAFLYATLLPAYDNDVKGVDCQFTPWRITCGFDLANGEQNYFNLPLEYTDEIPNADAFRTMARTAANGAVTTVEPMPQTHKIETETHVISSSGLSSTFLTDYLDGQLVSMNSSPSTKILEKFIKDNCMRFVVDKKYCGY